MRAAVNIRTVLGALKKISNPDKKNYDISLISGSTVFEAKQKVINASYLSDLGDEIPNYVNYLKAKLRGTVHFDKDKNQIIVKGSSETIKINFNPKKASTGGRVPAAVQERGTVFVFNQVLEHDKNYKKREDILADEDTRKGLEKIFKDYPDRLLDWTYSYFEHQKEFFKEFSKSQWKPFKYGKEEKDLVTFFRENMSKLVDNSQGGYKKVTRTYESWNPSDIWAVYNNKQINDRLEEKLNPEGRTLLELNNLLAGLIREKKLIGISLKKIKSGNADFKYVNVGRVKNALTIEKYEMNDISFDIKLSSDFSNVNFGASKKHQIQIGSSKEGNLEFNTIIKGSGGMGGQVPVKMLMKILKESGSGITFTNDHNKYPKTFSEYLNEEEKSNNKFQKMFNDLPITNKDYVTFENQLQEMYEGNKPYKATSKLMIINFFYDALRYNSRNEDFWVDVLYYGMKIGGKGGFAPHAKIS